MFNGRRWWGSYEGFRLREQIARARKGKLSQPQKRHLKLSGVSLPSARERKIGKCRLFKRLSAWWETTAIERQLEDFNDFLRKLAIVDLVNIVAGLTIIVSLGSWFWGRQERRENELFATREVIQILKEDKSGVVRVALERLHRNGFSLSGLPLTGTNLQMISLSDAYLVGADLSNANLGAANLSGADLSEANLSNADLSRVMLDFFHFKYADLSGANLYCADLSGANLWGANLSSAYLVGADLSGADLSNANLSNADLIGVLYDEDTTWPAVYDPPRSRDGYDRNP